MEEKPDKIGKPDNIEDYIRWLSTEFDVKIDDQAKNYYDSVTTKILNDFQKSPFWRGFCSKLKEYDYDYQLKKNGYHLLFIDDEKYQDGIPKLVIKPFESLVNKSYRKNIVENKSWPKEPTGGWILPTNWFSKINDIVRTTLVVKYLDGVEYLIPKLKDCCTPEIKKFDKHYEARDEGYYAAHVYIIRKFEIPTIDLKTKTIDVKLEIQITTQIQEVIKRLLHTYYEKNRCVTIDRDYKWQWDYNSEQFVANYLGHILHYVEGMIIEVRNKQIVEPDEEWKSVLEHTSKK